MLIGESPGFPGRVFNGKIDEVRIWNVARSQSQIQSTMNTILSQEYYSSPDSGLVGYWRLDDGTGQTAADLSYYGNDATLGTSANPDASDPTWVQANILILNVEDEINNNSFPTRFSLSQNYPNPFNPTTTIKFQIPELSFVAFRIYDVLGREIATLVDEEKPSGSYEVEFDASTLTSGIYFYQIQAGVFVETKKMVLLR